MATISPDSTAASSRPERSLEYEGVLRSLERCVGSDGRFVLLEGPDEADRAGILTALAAALPAEVQSLRFAAEAQPNFDPAVQLLDRLLLRAETDPRASVERALEHTRRRGISTVVLVDRAELLPPESIRWLLELSERPTTRSRIVLASAERARVLAALEGHGACVDLVRFEPPAVESSTGFVSPVPTLRVAETGREAVAVGTGIELGLGAEVAPTPAWFAFVWGMVISVSFFLGLGFAFVAAERSASLPLAPSRVEPAPAPPEAASALMEEEHSAPLTAPDDASAARDEVVVSDVRHAIALLSEEDAGGRHAAAELFLRERGPDPVGYELLDDLDARHATDPAEAESLLAARARVRAALCAAWADDVRGEAPLRLGCPGVGPSGH